MDNLVVIGISDTADRVVSFVERYKLFNIIGCAVDEKYIPSTNEAVLGGRKRSVWPLSKLNEYVDIENTYLFVAILWNHLNADRKNLYLHVKTLWSNAKFANIISPKASVRIDTMGDNCLIDDYVVIHEKAKIGNNVIIVANSFIAPYAIVSDHAFIAPHAIILGGAKVMSQTMVGTRAVVLNEVVIGEKCLIGTGAIVKHDVPKCCVVKNLSTQENIIQYSESEIENKWIAHYKKNAD